MISDLSGGMETISNVPSLLSQHTELLFSLLETWWLLTFRSVNRLFDGRPGGGDNDGGFSLTMLFVRVWWFPSRTRPSRFMKL
jgi:hypothetical protein